MPSRAPYNFDGRAVQQDVYGNLALHSSGNSDGNLAVDGTSTLTGAVTASGLVTASAGLVVTGGQGILGSKSSKNLLVEPTSTLASSCDGRQGVSSNTGALTSGTVYGVLVPVDSGAVIHNLSVFVTTAEAGGTHFWCGIADKNRNILAISADQTGATYLSPANAAVTTAITIDGVNPWTNNTTDVYYFFVMAAQGTTAPQLAAAPALSHANLAGLAPILAATFDTGKTTPPAVATQLASATAIASQLYAYAT